MRVALSSQPSIKAHPRESMLLEKGVKSHGTEKQADCLLPPVLKTENWENACWPFFPRINGKSLRTNLQEKHGSFRNTHLPSDTTGEAGLILAHQTPGYGPRSQASPHQVPENRRP